jgi:hypothetical protein
MVRPLTALPKTPLYKRLEGEGRLLPGADGTDNTSIGTNFVPKQIEYNTLVREYRHLYERLLNPSAIARRIGSKMRYIASRITRRSTRCASCSGFLQKFDGAEF